MYIYMYFVPYIFICDIIFVYWFPLPMSTPSSGEGAADPGPASGPHHTRGGGSLTRNPIDICPMNSQPCCETECET